METRWLNVYCNFYGLDHCREQVSYVSISFRVCSEICCKEYLSFPATLRNWVSKYANKAFICISCARNNKNNSNVQTIFWKNIFHKQPIVEIYLLIGCSQISKSCFFRSHWPTNRTVNPKYNSTWYCQLILSL